MILYKYMTLNSALEIIESSRIGFSKANTFNDPFELDAGSPSPKQRNPLQLFKHITQEAKRSIWVNNYGILCLTRNPLNPLMWAHYGDQHKGVVLGINVKTANLCSLEDCFIPAQFGSVVYTSTRPNHKIVSHDLSSTINVGNEHKYQPAHFERMQRLFLNKPSCWAYEEEVRIVKCLSDKDGISDPSGKIYEADINGRKMHLFDIPRQSIVEFYFGLRNKMICEDLFKAQDYIDSHPEITFRACNIHKDSWEMSTIDMPMIVGDNN